MHPRVSGSCTVPRYGGGWMHQFGHVYALQMELLAKSRGNWFRAVELWHTARHEGLALNNTHYTNILRQCAQAAQWEQSLLVLKQMRRDAIRPDPTGVSCAMVACVEAHQWEPAVDVFTHYNSTVKLKLGAHCFMAASIAMNKSGRHNDAVRFGSEAVEFIESAPGDFEVLLLESLDRADDKQLVEMCHRRIRHVKQLASTLESSNRLDE